MELHYSIRDLNEIETRVVRSIKALEDNGTLLGEEHNLNVIKKLVEENKQLREELLRKYSTDEH